MGKSTKAHRASYTLFRGKIPEGLFVLHECDTPLCVNPSHLKLGTHQENMADMVRKGRSVAGPGGNRKKLTDEQVVSIRSDSRSYAALGRIYGVSDRNISAIKRGRTWRGVPEKIPA